MTKKIEPSRRHTIVKNYIAIGTPLASFSSVSEICSTYSVHRNAPSKLLKKFNSHWSQIYPDKEVDYSVNIFQERRRLRKHRSLPAIEQYKKFIKKLPRGGFQTYQARCSQHSYEETIKEGMFYYYKKAVKDEVKSTIPSKKPSTYKPQKAKEWYEDLYEKYDFVIHLDGKSFEDQERIWKNRTLKVNYKRMSMAVEAKSGAIMGIRLEKSHNKTNAFMIVKEICEHMKYVFGEEKKILFITDAGSEYLNKKGLRGIEVTDLDTTRLVGYLKGENHALRITRKPQDNGFIENKNDYIERACLDDIGIQKMTKKEFVEHLDRFIQLNNLHLRGSRKSFRGHGNTPLENIQNRFGKQKGKQRIKGMHCFPVEELHKAPKGCEKMNLCAMIRKVEQSLMKHHFSSGKSGGNDPNMPMHPKSLDSSNFTQQNIDLITLNLNNRPMVCLGYETPLSIFANYFLSGVAITPLM